MMTSGKANILDRYAYLYEFLSKPERLEVSYRIRTLFEYAKGGKVLEMGIGFGLVTIALAGRFKYVVAVDGSQKVIQQVRKRLGQIQNATLIHSLFEEYTPDSKFDAIIMFDVLEHTPNPVETLSRARGWLAPRGKIHIIVPNAYSFHRRLGRAMGLIEDERNLAETDRKRGHYCIYTFDTLRCDIGQAGLMVELLKGVFIKPLPTEQMAGWSPVVLDGLYRLGTELPEFCSEIYAVAGAIKRKT